MEENMDQKIDLNYRPQGYFRPVRLQQHLISQVKGAVVRAHLESLFEQGRYEELDDLLGDTGVPTEVLDGLQSIHPSFMGGNYLPDLEKGEVEIARIELASTTGDVTSLYAKKSECRYIYRVVDEYEGDTLSGEAKMEAEHPLTLGQMADFFLGAWSLIEVLEMNEYQEDRDAALGFFWAKSDFYPNFHELCVERMVEHFDWPEQNDEPE